MCQANYLVMWKLVLKKPCESIIILISFMGLIASFVHFVFSCIYVNVHCLPFSLLSAFLSSIVMFIYFISLRGDLDEKVRKIHLTIILVICAFLVVMTVFFLIAYFSLSVRFMKEYNFKTIEVEDGNKHKFLRQNYWPVVTCIGMTIIWLVLLIDISRRQCFKLPKNRSISDFSINRNASIMSYYEY